MDAYVGTSGYSYKSWKGPFYPEDLKDREMLGFYSGRLRSVEINHTFRRMPRASVLEKWAEQVPDDFRFVLKASMHITHRHRLKEGVQDSLDYFWKNASVLGARLGPVLLQLPPNLKKDRERLESFLAMLPQGMRAAFEFRHESWMDEEIEELLRRAGAALVAADTEDGADVFAQIRATTDWGYLRLRREGYSEEELTAFRDRILAQPWQEVFVFFKHEEEAAGPLMAADFQLRL